MTAARQPHPLLPSEQRRNLLYIVADGAVVGLMSAGASFVSVLVIRLGASAFWVSLLSSIPSAISLAMTIPWSQFAGRQRRLERVFAFSRLAVHVVYPLIAVVPFFLRDEWAARMIIIIWSLSSLPGSLSNMMFTLVMGRAAPPERRAFLMSRRWIFLGIAKLIALPLISQLIDRLPFPRGYQLVYGINALLAFLALNCAMQLKVPAQETTPTPKKGRFFDHIREEMANLAQAKPFLIFVGGRAVLNLGLALITAMVPIYWIQHLGASDAWVGYFNATLSGATLIAYLPWVRIKRKYGTRWTLIPSTLGIALYPALLTLARAPVAVLPIIAFRGLVGAGLNLSFFDALLEACPPNKEARYVAISLTAVHLMGVIGPPIGAALLGVLNIRWVMALGTIVCLGGVAVFSFVRPGRRRTT